jgi:hypothetical protein
MKMRRLKRIGRLGALTTLAMACAACQTGLGTVPDGLIELYDMGSEDGMIELEIERNGVIREMEADVPISMLPSKVVAAARARAPGLEITGAEREMKAEGSTWEVKFRHEGRDWEYVIDDAGTIIETEKSLTPEEAPAVVLAAAEAAVTPSTFKSVEIINHVSGYQEYHVKRMRNGASYKIVLSPDGRVIRKVREHRAEIEIPLK